MTVVTSCVGFAIPGCHFLDARESSSFSIPEFPEMELPHSQWKREMCS